MVHGGGAGYPNTVACQDTVRTGPRSPIQKPQNISSLYLPAASNCFDEAHRLLAVLMKLGFAQIREGFQVVWIDGHGSHSPFLDMLFGQGR